MAGECGMDRSLGQQHPLAVRPRFALGPLQQRRRAAHRAGPHLRDERGGGDVAGLQSVVQLQHLGVRWRRPELSQTGIVGLGSLLGETLGVQRLSPLQRQLRAPDRIGAGRRSRAEVLRGRRKTKRRLGCAELGQDDRARLRVRRLVDRSLQISDRGLS